jgi:hypothetical protein
MPESERRANTESDVFGTITTCLVTAEIAHLGMCRSSLLGQATNGKVREQRDLLTLTGKGGSIKVQAVEGDPGIYTTATTHQRA